MTKRSATSSNWSVHSSSFHLLACQCVVGGSITSAPLSYVERGLERHCRDTKAGFDPTALDDLGQSRKEGAIIGGVYRRVDERKGLRSRGNLCAEWSFTLDSLWMRKWGGGGVVSMLPRWKFPESADVAFELRWASRFFLNIKGDKRFLHLPLEVTFEADSYNTFNFNI